MVTMPNTFTQRGVSPRWEPDEPVLFAIVCPSFLHALVAARPLKSKTAMRRLVDVTLDGLRP